MAEKRGKPANVRVICVDDANRPAEIPTTKWVKKGEPYTIIEFMVLNVQNRIMGVRLAEIDLTPCTPYEYFALTRFGIPVTQEMIEEMNNAIKELLDVKEEVLA